MVSPYEKYVVNELSTETLLRLARREVGAIHVKNFYPKDVAEKAVERAINHPKLGYYNKKYTSSVGRVCMPHIDSEWDEELAKKYHTEAVENIHDLRSLFFPHISPTDYIRLLLQEYWPAGANIQRLYARPCFVGAIRVFKPTVSSFYPHHDRMDEESDAPEVKTLVEQLVANMYLQVPEVGGDLQLWLRDPTPDEKQQIRDVEGLLPETVEPPRLIIHPEAGDLIIFSSRMLHAVTPGKDQHRVGMAAFIGCHGENEPLTYWS